MVGVGPGVGADVIRQRRKRADKLKKEQQVRVINIHGTPTLAAVAPKAKKKDEAHYHWHYTPARNEQVFNRKKTDYLANKSKYYKNTNRPISRTKQKSLSSRSSQSKSSRHSLSQYTLNSTKFLDVKILSSSADICIEATTSTSESYSEGSRSTVFRDSFSFSETSLSSSSTPKTTTSDIPTVECTNKSCKSYNSFCTNEEALEQDPKNESDDNPNEFKGMNTDDESPSHNAQKNFCIPKIHIEYIETSEPEHGDLDNVETLNSITKPITIENNISAASSESIQVLKECPNRDTLIDQMENLSINSTNRSNITLDPSDRKDDAYINQKSFQRKRKIGSIKKLSKSKQEITIKDYHKHVARQTVLDTLRRKRASKQNKNEKTGSVRKFASASHPKCIGSNFRYLTSFKKSKSNSSLDFSKNNLDSVSSQTEESKELKNESSSLKETNESSKSETSNASIVDTTNASVSLLNNAQRFSFKHLKDQSKTAISTIQKFIEVTFDRGKSE